MIPLKLLEASMSCQLKAEFNFPIQSKVLSSKFHIIQCDTTTTSQPLTFIVEVNKFMLDAKPLSVKEASEVLKFITSFVSDK